jgi:hypothetical protein
MPTLKPRDARALMLGAAVLVPSLLYVGVIAPEWRLLMAQRAQLSAASDSLAHERKLMMEIPELQKRHAQMVAWLTNEARRLFDGTDDISATSGLTEYVTRAASQSGVSIRQTETHPSVPVTGALRALRLDVQVDGNTRSVLTFLKLIENGNRLVRVGRLVVGHGGSAGTAAMPAAAFSSAAPGTTGLVTRSRLPLSVTAEIYGYAFVPTPDSLRISSSEQGAAYQPIGKTFVEPVDIADALAHDPFSPDRGATAAPSTGPGRMAAAPPPFPVKLVGTAVDQTGSGFAVCQLGDQPAVIVHQGEQIAGYTLRAIDRGSIVLADAGGKLVHLTIPTPEA